MAGGAMFGAGAGAGSGTGARTVEDWQLLLLLPLERIVVGRI